jgi:hypothetical protein
VGTTTTTLALYKPAVGETGYATLFGASMDLLDGLPGKPVHRAGALAGLTGATSTTRYAGGTASVAPSTGTFAVGDFVVSQTGHVYVCTVAGSPGTWVDLIQLIDVWIPFTIPGTVTAGVNAFKIPIVGTAAGSVFGMRLALGTAGTTTTTVGLLRDGTTAMFTTNPSMATGVTLSTTSGTPIGSPTFTSSNWFQVSVIGAGTGAANLTGMIGLRRTA